MVRSAIIMKFIFLFFITASYASAAEQCLEITDQQMKNWMSRQPELPGFEDLIKAKKLIDAERRYSLKLGTDKRAHCYLGCRISEVVNFETAQFAAWQKEYNDATDCDPKTHFEVADFDATVKGAKRESKKSNSTTSKVGCTDYCKKLF